MNTDKKLIIASVLITVIISAVVFHTLQTAKPVHLSESAQEISAAEPPFETEEVQGYEARETEPFILPEGEEGDADYKEPRKEIPVIVEDGKGTKKLLIETAFDCNGCLVYAPDNSSEEWRSGYIKGTSDENYNPLLDFYAEEDTGGINSEGYVVWLFRQVFGIVPDSFENVIGMYKSGEKILKENLEVGDIGMSSLDSSADTRYGVCIGFKEGSPVFTHLSPVADKGKKSGTNYISYLKELKDAPLNGVEPISLKYFVRPDVEWVE